MSGAYNPFMSIQCNHRALSLEGLFVDLLSRSLLRFNLDPALVVPPPPPLRVCTPTTNPNIFHFFHWLWTVTPSLVPNALLFSFLFLVGSCPHYTLTHTHARSRTRTHHHLLLTILLMSCSLSQVSDIGPSWLPCLYFLMRVF